MILIVLVLKNKIMEIKERIKFLLPLCEEQFYKLSEYLCKEDAERLAPIVLDSIIRAQIKVHEELINTSKNLLESRIKKQSKLGEFTLDSVHCFERGSYSGMIIAHEGRIKTHETYLSELKMDLEILQLKLI